MDSKRNSVVGGIVCAAVVLCCVNGLGAAEFAGGTGEPNDPFQIATAEQLISIGSDPNLAKSHFVLTASIDLSGTTRSSAVIPSFYGSLDGNGFAIQGLKARGLDSMGLFGRIEASGRVANLRMVDVDLIGVNYIGTLAAYSAGAVRDCTSTGRVTGLGQDVGGLVGYNAGTTAGSFSAAEVTGNNLVGGLVGTNARGILTDCHSAGIVVGYSYTGGLVGGNTGGIAGCFADSEVVGMNDLGGLVGENSGSIFSCYSTGAVAGGNGAGGLVGSNQGTISRSYSLAHVTSQGTYTDLRLGGLAGRVVNSVSIVKSCYFLAPADGGGPDNKIGTPLTAAQMAQQASFSGWDFWGTDADGMTDHWFMPTDSFPVLVWQAEITGLRRVPDVTGLPLERAKATLSAAGFVPGDVSYDFHCTLLIDYVVRAEPYSVAPLGATIDLIASSGKTYEWTTNPGDGTESNPYEIDTPGQLESLTNHPELWDKHFVLTADMDIAGRTYQEALIAPGRHDATAGFQGTPFTGSLDGQGYAIRNLFIQADDRDYAGLFGMAGKNGRIDRLHLQDATLRTPPAAGTPTRGSASTTYFGVLAGCNEGTIADCSATGGIVIARTDSDGLVGVNRGTMTDCHVDVVVTSSGTTVIIR